MKRYFVVMFMLICNLICNAEEDTDVYFSFGLNSNNIKTPSESNSFFKVKPNTGLNFDLGYTSLLSKYFFYNIGITLIDRSVIYESTDDEIKNITENFQSLSIYSSFGAIINFSTEISIQPKASLFLIGYPIINEFIVDGKNAFEDLDYFDFPDYTTNSLMLKFSLPINYKIDELFFIYVEPSYLIQPEFLSKNSQNFVFSAVALNFGIRKVIE